MSDPGDDLTIDIDLRPIDAVGERMLVLASLLQLAIAVSDPDDNRDPAQIEQEIDDIRDALLIGRWSDQLSASEREFLSLSPKEIDEHTILETMWRVEALAALSWAVSHSPALPAPWRQADAALIVPRIPAPWEEVDAFTATLRYRPENEIAAERERAEVWGWRAAIEEDLITARGRERSELQKTIQETVQEAFAAGLLPNGRDDFLVNSRPFSDVDPEARAELSEISLQRLWALNWVCGFGNSWDTVPLDL